MEIIHQPRSLWVFIVRSVSFLVERAWETGQVNYLLNKRICEHMLMNFYICSGAFYYTHILWMEENLLFVTLQFIDSQI